MQNHSKIDECMYKDYLFREGIVTSAKGVCERMLCVTGALNTLSPTLC